MPCEHKLFSGRDEAELNTSVARGETKRRGRERWRQAGGGGGGDEEEEDGGGGGEGLHLSSQPAQAAETEVSNWMRMRDGLVAVGEKGQDLQSCGHQLLLLEMAW